MSAHVVPRGDLIEHDATSECLCGPLLLPVMDEAGDAHGQIWVHNSLDGREQAEP